MAVLWSVCGRIWKRRSRFQGLRWREACCRTSASARWCVVAEYCFFVRV